MDIIDISQVRGEQVKYGASIRLLDEDTEKEIAYKIAKRQSFLDCAISQVETRLRG